MNREQRQNHLPAVILFLFLLLEDSLATYRSQQPPDPLLANISAAEFSAERDFRHIEALPTAPRPVGTTVHRQTRDYILGDLRGLGLNSQIQGTTIVDPQSSVYPGMIVAGNQAFLLASYNDPVATAFSASYNDAGVVTFFFAAISVWLNFRCGLGCGNSQRR